MAKIPPSDEDLKNTLRRLMKMLRASAERYDAGDLDESLTMSSLIRTLAHDTSSSHSLLGQVGLGDSLSWVDQSIVGRKYFRDGRTEIAIEGILADGSSIFKPPVGQDGLADIVIVAEKPTYVPTFNAKSAPIRKTDFKRWWTLPFMDLPHGKKFSRKKLITEIANTDGGSHVDPKGLDVSYAAFKRSGHGLFWLDTETDISNVSPNFRSAMGNAAAASVRQIAYEMDLTLAKQGY